MSLELINELELRQHQSQKWNIGGIAYWIATIVRM